MFAQFVQPAVGVQPPVLFMAETKTEPRTPSVPCVVRNQPSGGLSVTFQIDAPTAARLKARAQSMELSRYIFENILKPAVSTHVY